MNPLTNCRKLPCLKGGVHSMTLCDRRASHARYAYRTGTHAAAAPPFVRFTMSKSRQEGARCPDAGTKRARLRNNNATRGDDFLSRNFCVGEDLMIKKMGSVYAVGRA